MKFPDFLQRQDFDCGVAIAYIAALINGIKITYEEVYEKTNCSERHGVRPENLESFLDEINLKIEVVEPIDFRDMKRLLRKHFLIACPVKIECGHWILLYKIIKNEVCYHDPASGRKKMPLDELEKLWYDDDSTGTMYSKYAIVIKGKRSNAYFK